MLTGIEFLVLIVVVFPLSLCLCTAGKPLPYMPYDMKLALDQEPHSGRPGSPYRLSPRELSKVSPQPDPNAPSVSRYSVPPGKSTHLYPLPSLHSYLLLTLADIKFALSDSGISCVRHRRHILELLAVILFESQYTSCSRLLL